MKCLLPISLLAMVVLLSNLPAATSPPADEKEPSLTDLPGFKGYKADAYVAAAASLQALGKERAVPLLTELAKGGDRDGQRAILLCRMLFVAKPKGDFRRPSLGAPNFVGPVEAKDWRTVWKDWPLEPIELVDGVPFLVVYSHNLGGVPESAREYLNYCLKSCDWNATAFKPKTADEKRKALAKLVASLKWKEPLTEQEKKQLSAQID